LLQKQSRLKAFPRSTWPPATSGKKAGRDDHFR
jgi:hypothetical protein